MRITPTLLLVVEDSDEDFRAIETGLRRFGLPDSAIRRCLDGDEALDFLYQRNAHTAAPRPGVVLLDLNLPGTDGRTVLAALKRDEHLKTIPVVVFTTSGEHRDIDECYHAGANAYVQKPLQLKDFLATINLLAEHWCRAVVLPRSA
jgi:CheY-like chemotaxis protein